MFGEESYKKVVLRAYRDMRTSKEFLSDEPFCAGIMCYPIGNGGQWQTILVEATARKLAGNKNGVMPVDFGIIKLTVSDEDMPDVALDRYNDYLKEKEKK